jgi:hypothetical protein
MVGQHHAARAHADALRAPGDVAHQHGGGRAGNAGHVVVLGQPVARETQRRAISACCAVRRAMAAPRPRCRLRARHQIEHGGFLQCQDDRCDLGRWLNGSGQERLGHSPAFGMLVARHRYFHQQAAAVITCFQAGDQAQALQLLNGRCRHASNQVLLLLKELKRGMGQ